jgi:hypothetical protein
MNKEIIEVIRSCDILKRIIRDSIDINDRYYKFLGIGRIIGDIEDEQ